MNKFIKIMNKLINKIIIINKINNLNKKFLSISKSKKYKIHKI